MTRSSCSSRSRASRSCGTPGVALGEAALREHPQPRVGGVALGDLPLGQRGRGLAQVEGQLVGEGDAARDGLRRRHGVRRQRGRRLGAAAQVGRARQVEPAVELGQAASGAHGRHRARPAGAVAGWRGGRCRPRRRRGRGRRPAGRARRWSHRHRDVAMSSTSDVLETEQRRQPVERLGRGALAAGRERLPDGALAAAGQHHPVTAPALAQLVEVVDRAALLVTAQVGVGHRRGEPVVALDPARQHQQVAALGVGHAVLRTGQAEGELGAEDGRQVVRRRGLGQHRGAVEAVVVGDRERVQAEAHGLLDELGGGARAVEEAEVAVAVQLGVRRDRGGALDRPGRAWRRACAATPARRRPRAGR